MARAISTYTMSCFDLTQGLCDDMTSMINRYWWEQQDNEKKVHRLSGDVLSSRKEMGGLGFRDLHLFNLAILARQEWRLIMMPNSLCAQVMQDKYYPYGDILAAKESPGISYT